MPGTSGKKPAVKDENLGPFIATEMTRCIHCTRCIRFCDEVTGTGELGIVHRGSKNEIDIPRKHDGTPTQLLDNKLSGNVVLLIWGCLKQMVETKGPSISPALDRQPLNGQTHAPSTI